MTTVCDCVTPTTTRCDCHATEHEPAYSGVEAESVAVSQAEKAALHIQPNDSTPELKDPRDERIRELVIALNEAHANFIKEYWARRAAESRRDELQFRFDAILGSEITARRKKQDDIWGGPEHDDAHKPDDWIRFLEDYVRRTRYCEDDETCEHFMFDVIALAVAAIRSSRRKRNA